MKYFDDEVHNGNWDEVEKYLSGFTKVDDNGYSMKIFFEIRKQKYLEALDKHDRSKPVEILVKNSRLRTLTNQSLNWQHQLCKNHKPNPVTRTLFVDHSCGQPNGACAPPPANSPFLGSLPKVGGFPPLGAHGHFNLHWLRCQLHLLDGCLIC